MNNILILGKGWLGSIIYDFLLSKGIECKATVTNKTFNSINEIDGNIFAYDLGGKLPEINLSKLDYLLYTLPPSSSENYASNSILLFESIRKINPNLTIIYTSSTSVYGDIDSILNEDSETLPMTYNAKEIKKIEDYLELNGSNKILRLGGLVGPKRHPVYYLSSKKGMNKNPDQKVNLIHAFDIANFIYQTIVKKWSFRIVNLVCPDHPSRKEYYTKFATKLELKLTEFEEFNERKGKIVESKVLEQLPFTFIFKTPFEFKI